jgi:dodecin
MERKLGRKEAKIRMSVARVTELSATSETSFEDAINEAVARATKTLRGVEGAWIKDQNVLIEDGKHSWLQGQCGGYFRAGGVAL